MSDYRPARYGGSDYRVKRCGASDYRAKHCTICPGCTDGAPDTIYLTTTGATLCPGSTLNDGTVNATAVACHRTGDPDTCEWVSDTWGHIDGEANMAIITLTSSPHIAGNTFAASWTAGTCNGTSRTNTRTCLIPGAYGGTGSIFW